MRKGFDINFHPIAKESNITPPSEFCYAQTFDNNPEWILEGNWEYLSIFGNPAGCLWNNINGNNPEFAYGDLEYLMNTGDTIQLQVKYFNVSSDITPIIGVALWFTPEGGEQENVLFDGQSIYLLPAEIASPVTDWIQYEIVIPPEYVGITFDRIAVWKNYEYSSASTIVYVDNIFIGQDCI